MPLLCIPIKSIPQLIRQNVYARTLSIMFGFSSILQVMIIS